MAPDASPATASGEDPSADRPRPRWLFRGRTGAWETLAASIADDPTRAVRWPIAPSGPSMLIGDAVLLWRSGRGGGIAALCRVLDEPEAVPRPGQPPEVVVSLRIDRAYHHPIAPATLARHSVLRPLAFMDLLDETERRVTPAQEEALAELIAARDRAGETDPDDVALETRTDIAIPVRLKPLVEELLIALGADEPAPARAPDGGRDTSPDTPSSPSNPTDLQVVQADEVARTHGAGPFTIDDVAKVWRTGVGTARSRIERLIDSGLVERAGTLRAEDRPGVRPARGRPPILYRLARG